MNALSSGNRPSVNTAFGMGASFPVSSPDNKEDLLESPVQGISINENVNINYGSPLKKNQKGKKHFREISESSQNSISNTCKNQLEQILKSEINIPVN